MLFRTLVAICAASTIFACKLRLTNSETKDLLLFNSKMEATLYYSEGTGAEERLIRARCGPAKAGLTVDKFNGLNFRDQCKKIEFDGPMPELLNRWDRQYFTIIKRNRYTEAERKVQDFILGEIRQKNAQGQPSAVAVNMDDPTFRSSVTLHYRVLSELTQPSEETPDQQDSGDPAHKESSPKKQEDDATKEPPRLIPTDGGDNSVLFRDTLTIPAGARRPYQLRWDLKKAANSQFFKVSLRAVKGQNCWVAILSLGTSRNEMLAADVTMPETFRRANGQNTPIASFSAVIINSSGLATQCEVTISSTEKLPLPMEVAEERDRVMRETFGGRPHRLAHYMWHAVRNAFAQPGTTDAHRRIYASYGWAAPRPILYYGNRMDIEATARTGAGEDFLYMHRRMVLQLKNALSKRGLTMYDSWKRVPTPSSTLFPLAVINAELRQQMPDGYQQIADWERQFQPDRIDNYADLSSLGVALELTIHNALHSRWSGAMNRMRPASDDPITRSASTAFGWMWDDPNYDHLSDSYGAHVNPLFWRIHGWVDDRIEEWLKVKGYEVVSENCARETQSRCLPWRKDAWMGPEHVNELISIRQTGTAGNVADDAHAILSESGFHKVNAGILADQPNTPAIRR